MSHWHLVMGTVFSITCPIGIGDLDRIQWLFYFPFQIETLKLLKFGIFVRHISITEDSESKFGSLPPLNFTESEISGMIKALIHMISMVFLREPIESMSIREFVMNFDKNYVSQERERLAIQVFPERKPLQEKTLMCSTNPQTFS